MAARRSKKPHRKPHRPLVPPRVPELVRVASPDDPGAEAKSEQTPSLPVVEPSPADPEPPLPGDIEYQHEEVELTDSDNINFCVHMLEDLRRWRAEDQQAIEGVRQVMSAIHRILMELLRVQSGSGSGTRDLITSAGKSLREDLTFLKQEFSYQRAELARLSSRLPEPVVVPPAVTTPELVAEKEDDPPAEPEPPPESKPVAKTESNGAKSLGEALLEAFVTVVHNAPRGMNKTDEAALMAAYDLAVRRSDGCARTATIRLSEALSRFSVNESSSWSASPRKFLEQLEAGELLL